MAAHQSANSAVPNNLLEHVWTTCPVRCKLWYSVEIHRARLRGRHDDSKPPTLRRLDSIAKSRVKAGRVLTNSNIQEAKW
jgi:hypothetical protein